MSDIPEDIVDRLCPTQDQDLIPWSHPDTLAGLTQSIWDYFQRNKETRKQLERKNKLWRDIEPHLRSKMDCELKVTGSTFTGYGGLGSDVDMCLFTKPCSMKSPELFRR